MAPQPSVHTDASRGFATGTAEAKVLRRGPGRLLPHRLGDYTLFDHIGRGGMADIYRARVETGLGICREVVIKEVLPELRDIPRFAELLVAEAKIASGLSHSNIVTVEHLGRDQDTLHIAMEYVEGLDLRELLRQCGRQRIPLPVDCALWVVTQILHGLDYAHRFRLRDSIGIVHRDVSPSNVLLSLDGEVKLCDFGIARANDAVIGISDDAIEGKAGYMSPEQATGDAVDCRSDIFAAGIIMWEMMAGKRLYKAKDGESLLDVAARAEVPPLVVRGLPNEETLHAICHLALSNDPSARYETAGEMANDLELYLVRSGLMTSSIKFGTFLSETFGPALRSARRSREMVVEALSRGPLALVVPIRAPIAVKVTDAEEVAKPTAKTGKRRESTKKKRAGSTTRQSRGTLKRVAVPVRNESKARSESDRFIRSSVRHKIEDPPPSLAATTSDIEPGAKAGKKTSKLAYLVLAIILAAGLVAFLLRN